MRKIENISIIGMGALGILYGTHIAKRAGFERIREIEGDYSL